MVSRGPWPRDVPRDPDLIGGPRATVHYPRGWGMASNTPFRLYKGKTFAGGVRVPFIVSWPIGSASTRRAPPVRVCDRPAPDAAEPCGRRATRGAPGSGCQGHRRCELRDGPARGVGGQSARGAIRGAGRQSRLLSRRLETAHAPCARDAVLGPGVAALRRTHRPHGARKRRRRVSRQSARARGRVGGGGVGEYRVSAVGCVGAGRLAPSGGGRVGAALATVAGHADARAATGPAN